jgi:hypothetical protein
MNARLARAVVRIRVTDSRGADADQRVGRAYHRLRDLVQLQRLARFD